MSWNENKWEVGAGGTRIQNFINISSLVVDKGGHNFMFL